MWTFLVGLITGGTLLRLIEYGIQWKREAREQHAEKTTHEKDRPRFRIDTTKLPTSHSFVHTLLVKINSLGSLPLTIDKGEVFIEASHYPEKEDPQKLDGREISSIHPIEVKFTVPLKLVQPLSGGEPLVKLVCKFSHSGSKQPEHYEAVYNHRRCDFDPADKIQDQEQRLPPTP